LLLEVLTTCAIDQSRCSIGRRARRGGFTLLELLVVMSIIALLGSLSIGAFTAARRNYLLESSAAEIATVFRAARNSAILTRSATHVVVDPVRRTVSAFAFETIDEWSFEEPPADGSLFAQETFTVRGATRVEGRTGDALRFRSGGAHVDCGTHEKYSPRDSFSLAAWIRHELVPPVLPSARDARRGSGTATGALIARRGTVLGGREPRAFAIADRERSWGLWLTELRALEVRIGDWRARTDDEIVAPERWVRVTLEYERGAVQVTVDGVPRALTPVATLTATARDASAPNASGAPSGAPAQIPASAAPFRISHPESPFPGAIDEVVLRGTIAPTVYEYPELEHLVSFRRVITFDRDGRLDASRHEGPIDLVLVELPDLALAEKCRAPGPFIVPEISYETWRESRAQALSPGEQPKARAGSRSAARSRSSAATSTKASPFQASSGSEPRVASIPDQRSLEAAEAARLLSIPGVRSRTIEIDRLGVVR